MFIGAGILGKSSWLDCKIVENFEEVDFRPEYLWGEVVQRNALRAAKSGAQVIIENPRRGNQKTELRVCGVGLHLQKAHS